MRDAKHARWKAVVANVPLLPVGKGVRRKIGESSAPRKLIMASKSRRELIEEMLVEDPTDAFLHYGLAMEYVSAGQFDEAIRRFRHLIGIAPEYVPAYLQIAQALVH